MFPLVFHPEIRHEIGEAYEWYQRQAQGLGDDYMNELDLAFQMISETPDTWPNFKEKFQRYILSRFPFAIIYRLQANTIYVVAVMHQSRKPDYWLERI